MPGRPNRRARQAQAMLDAEKKAVEKAKGRKREKSSVPKTRDQRVEEIVYLMIKGQWSTATLFEKAKVWNCSVTAMRKAADRASVRIETATGELHHEIAQAKSDLDEIMREARKHGQFAAAVRAVDSKMKLVGALAQHRPGRKRAQEEDGPRGLPPELAALTPPPTLEEVEHFATTSTTTPCAIEGCRVHGKASPPPAPHDMH